MAEQGDDRPQADVLDEGGGEGDMPAAMPPDEDEGTQEE